MQDPSSGVYNNKMKSVLKAEIFGRVQGVGFRMFVKRHADRLGLTGIVSNSDHGTVEVIARGGEEKLHDFLSKIKKGPLFANVSKVEYSFESYAENFDEFTVVRDESGIIYDQKKAFTNFIRNLLRLNHGRS